MRYDTNPRVDVLANNKRYDASFLVRQVKRRLANSAVGIAGQGKRYHIESGGRAIALSVWRTRKEVSYLPLRRR